jgi:cell division protein FtsW
MGFVALMIGLKIPHLLYKKFALLGLIAGTGLLGLTLIPGLGVRILGASRWLNIAGIQIQPVEFSKFFIAVFLASSLENKKAMRNDFFKGIFPVLFVVGFPVLILILQPDLGNSILILGITCILIFLYNARLLHLILLGLLGACFFVINLLTHPYQMARITSFISPFADPLGKDYHMVQSLIAVGSGGFLGSGLGQSKLKYFYLPLQYSDFIFAILCEEGGFLLAAGVICLFLFLFYRGLNISWASERDFSKYLGVALTLFIVIQAFINMGMVIGFFPVTGIPLTFISLGGTSLISSMFSMGVLLNISKYRKQEEKK